MGGPAPTLTDQVISAFTWSPSRINDRVQAATYVAHAVFVLAVFVLGAATGRARPLAAFVGGWGASMGAMAVSGIAFAIVAGDDAFLSGDGFVDRAYSVAAFRPGPMVAVGWLFGIAVLLGSFGAEQPKVAPAGGGYTPPPSSSAGPPPSWEPPSAAPAPPPPAAAPPPPAPAAPPAGGPSIGPPPDRTQVYGQPPP